MPRQHDASDAVGARRSHCDYLETGPTDDLRLQAVVICPLGYDSAVDLGQCEI